MHLTASQIRQDLNCFGGFGQQGYGYSVQALHDEIGHILGIDNQYSAIMIGAGNLGKAVATHMSFLKNEVLNLQVFLIAIKIKSDRKFVT